METYILKIALCSSLFILFHNLVLKNEKLLKFNRFYLITTLLISLAIPFLHYEIPAVEVQKMSGLQIGDSQNVVQKIFVENPIFIFQNVIFTIYFLVIFFLLTKFLKNLWRINSEISRNEKQKNGNFWLILKNEKTAPHSFWNYIFINKNDYQNGRINEKIILHETAHLDQKHSLDLIFIELILIIFWFNPAFYFYKKAILTNHEYLADDIVLNRTKNISEYQNLLLTQLISEKILFSNSFNLINTKNRIKMMTKTLSKTAKLKSWLSIPLAIIIFFAFAEKIPAKEMNMETSKKVTSKPTNLKTSIFEKFLDFKTEKTILKMDTISPKNKKLDRKSEVAPPPPLLKKEMENKKIDTDVFDAPPPPIPSPEISAEFPGGMNVLRQLIVSNFDASVFKGNEGLIKTTISFFIDTDGKVSDISTFGENKNFNEEAFKTFKTQTDNILWKPASTKGTPVRSMFKIPLTMKFESAIKPK